MIYTELLSWYDIFLSFHMIWIIWNHLEMNVMKYLKNFMIWIWFLTFKERVVLFMLRYVAYDDWMKRMIWYWWLASRVWWYPTKYDMWLIWTKFEMHWFHEKGWCPKKAFEWKGSSLETVVINVGHMILYPTWEDNNIIGTSHMGGFLAVYSHWGIPAPNPGVYLDWRLGRRAPEADST